MRRPILRRNNVENDGNTQYLLFCLASGLLFLVFYFYQDFAGRYRQLYWPLVILMLVFLFANTLANAGASGAPITILSRHFDCDYSFKSRRYNNHRDSVVLYCRRNSFLLEQMRPEWITQYASPTDRLIDVSSNFYLCADLAPFHDFQVFFVKTTMRIP